MKNTLFAILIVLSAGCLFADNIWVGGSSTDWSDSANWSAEAIPIESDIVRVNYSDNPCTISDGGSYSVNNVWIMRWSPSANDAVLNLVNGSLAVTGYQFNMGDSGTGTNEDTEAILNIEENFSLTVSQRFYAGGLRDAVININGGNFEVNNFLTLGNTTNSSSGFLYVNSGEVFLNTLNIATNSSRVVISDGVLKINGDARTAVQSHISSGIIVPLSSQYSLIVDYDAVNDQTVVYATDDILMAYNPFPVDQEAQAHPLLAYLTWSPATDAVEHKVYFGTSAGSLSLVGDTTDTFMSVPGSSLSAGTYYWRVDEVLSDSSVITGDEWSFTVTTSNHVLRWKGTQSSDWNDPMNWDKGAVPRSQDYTYINYSENDCTIDGLSIEAYSIYLLRYATTAYNAVLNLKSGSLVVPGYEFNLGIGQGSGIAPTTEAIVNVGENFNLTVGQRLIIGQRNNGVFNLNGGNVLAYGYIRLSTDGENATGTLNLNSGNLELQGYLYLNANGTIIVDEGTMTITGNRESQLLAGISSGQIASPLGRIPNVEYDAVNDITTLSSTLSPFAYSPQPANNAGGLWISGNQLSWLPKMGTVTHNVYFGTTPYNMALIATLQEPNRSVSLDQLDFAGRYYWRVDEVDDQDVVTTGEVWSFRTTAGVTIDTFEDYPSSDPNSLWTNWTAQGGADATLEFDMASQGVKSMKISYDNTLEGYSAAVFTYQSPQDWAEHNLSSLSFSLHGMDDNEAEDVYVQITDADDVVSDAVFYGNGEDFVQAVDSDWITFVVDFAWFGGNVNFQAIKTVTIGISNTGFTSSASGVIYVDNLRAYPPRCFAEDVLADLTGDCSVDMLDFVTLADNWLDDGTPKSPSSPVLWYDFNEDTSAPGFDSSIAYDAAGEYDGQIVDDNYSAQRVSKDGRDAFRIAPVFGNAGIQVPQEAFSSLTNKISIATWANVDESLIPAYSYLFKFSFDNQSNLLFAVLPSIGYNLYNRMGVAGDELSQSLELSQYANSWHHWVFTRDYSTGELAVYIDGQIIAQVFDNSLIAGAAFSDFDYAWVGSRESTSNKAIPSLSFRGWIDDFQVYDYILSQSEIAYLAGASEAPIEYDFDDNGQLDSGDLKVLAENWLDTILWP